MTWHLDDYRCTLLCGILRCSFQETSPRKTAENTAKHRGGGVGSVVANHRGGGVGSVVANHRGGGVGSVVANHRGGGESSIICNNTNNT